MPPITDRAIILQAFPYSETSKILRLLTRAHGVRSVIAKGARRPRSRLAGVLEPFGQGTATLYVKQTRELQTLSAFDLEYSRHGLGRDLLRFGAAALLAEIVIRTGSESPDPQLFDHMHRALDRLGGVEGVALEAVALAETWALVGRLGFAPTLDACLGCGRRLDPGEDVLFDYGAGGVRCRDCGGGRRSRSMPAHARADLVAFARGDRPDPRSTGAHWQLIARFLTYHVLEGGSLRSMEFLTRALELA